MGKRISTKPKPDQKVETLRKQLTKRWGEDAVMTGDDPRLRIVRIPSGVLSLDYLLSGGVARGRHTEVFGDYGIGKTYFTYRLIGNAQKLGYRCAFIDVEGTYDPQFAKHAGVNRKRLAFHRQTHGNRVVNFMEVLLRSGDFDIIVLDSIAALLPMQEFENDMERGSYGMQQAKLMSEALRRLTAANRSTALVYINQLRDSVGSVFAKRSTTSGGRAMSFYAGTRLEFVRIENIKRKVKAVDPKKLEYKDMDLLKGHRVLARVEKDKTGAAKNGEQASFVFDYDLGGIDPIEDLLYLGRVTGHVKKTGNSWFVEGYDDERQVGRRKFKKWLRSNKAICEELEENIRAAGKPDDTGEEDDE